MFFFAHLFAEEFAKSMDKEGKGIGVILTNTNFIGIYALHAACESGSLPVIRYLVEEHNVDVNKADTMRGSQQDLQDSVFFTLLYGIWSHLT